MRCFEWAAIGLIALIGAVTETQAVEIVGHRGASYDAPENTLASVNLAWKRGADAVEIDIYLSKDGKIVAFHDKTTKRTAGGGKHKIADLTLAELRKLDAGSWKNKKYKGEQIPTLAEVLKTIPAGKRLFIEIKCGPEVLPVLRRDLKTAGKKPQQTAIIGFSYDTMKKAKIELPQLDVFWVVGLKQNKVTKRWRPSLNKLIRDAKSAGLQGVHLSNKPVIDRKYVTKLHHSGLKVFVWTVNDLKSASRLKAAGVDGITTDRPGWLKKQLAERR